MLLALYKPAYHEYMQQYSVSELIRHNMPTVLLFTVDHLSLKNDVLKTSKINLGVSCLLKEKESFKFS